MNPGFLYVVWIVIAVAVLASAIFLIRFQIRIQPLIDRLEGTVQLLDTSRPKIGRILDDLEAELTAMRGIGAKANRIAGSADSVTTGIRVAVEPIITEVSNLTQSVRHVRAAAVAGRTGLTAWRDHRRRNGGEPPAEIEHDEES